MSSTSSFAYKLLAVFGLAAPGLTFLIAISDVSMERKTFALIAISLIYAAICLWAFLKDKQEKQIAHFVPIAAEAPTDDVETDPISVKLRALEEAGTFFGSSLRSEDIFRLVSSRVREIIRFESSALLLPDSEQKGLFTAHCDDLDDEKGRFDAELGIGPAGLAFLSGEIEFGDLPASDTEGRQNSPSAVAALPLLHNNKPFAVYQINFAKPIDDKHKMLPLLGSVAESIAPLFLGAQAFESSLSNALTDPLTDLPNERAFFLVLETQVAESLRFGNERPLSIVVADIKGFDDANRMFGHSTGDNIIRFTGETIRALLRRMDFLARSSGDEFIMLLPTADERTAAEIIERISLGFANSVFQISEHESTKIWLNFGLATFASDGETAQELLHTARSRKQQAKSEDPGNIVWSDKEYLN